MNANEFNVLQNLSAGVDNSASQNVQPVIVANQSPVTSLQPVISPTNPTVNISPEALVRTVCGMFALEIDTTGETRPSQLVLGGSADSADASYNGFLRATYSLGTTPLINEDAFSLVYPSNVTAFPASTFLQWFNSYLCCNPMIVGTVAVTSMGGDADSFLLFRKSAFRVFSNSPSGNFSQSNYALKPDLCNPCFNASDDLGVWEGKFPLSSNTGIAINVPINLRCQMEFSVIGTANTGAFASC